MVWKYIPTSKSGLKTRKKIAYSSAEERSRQHHVIWTTYRTRLGQKAHQYLPNNERQRFCLKPVFNNCMWQNKQLIYWHLVHETVTKHIINEHRMTYNRDQMSK